ncbi:MAG TPA: DUF4340 domain-containing protein, partial [Candidatus Saccharimonadales bacterium]|nr:DUF4340 domain-containing protein [Candidatus Saccharimonadales bacterium]
CHLARLGVCYSGARCSSRHLFLAGSQAARIGMIRPSTVVYLVLLLALLGAYFYLRNRPQAADIELTVEPSAEATQAYLFSAEDGIPTSIRIESKTKGNVEIARDAENSWTLTQPVEAPADQAAAEAAASQVTSMRILDQVPDVDPKIVGLENPEYVLTVKFTSGGERTVDVGVITPTESGYYVRDAEGEVVIVSRDAIDPLLSLLDNPPYLGTPTPDPTTLEAITPPAETATP